MILAEYHRFLQTLSNAHLQELCKVANLVLQYFDELVPLTTAQGQRVKKFVELAQANWESISADIQPVPAQARRQRVIPQRLLSRRPATTAAHRPCRSASPRPKANAFANKTTI